MAGDKPKNSGLINGIMQEVYMQTIHALIITISILVIGGFLLYAVLKSSEIITRKRYDIRSLFDNFKQKLWMTIGIGIVFTTLYVILLTFGSFKLDSQTKLSFFNHLNEHKIDYIYLGLAIFVATSLFIYAIRLIIIYLYNSQKR